jgi:putative hydroxymethylpyrimidine transport system substrate-binding protein
LRVPFTVRRRIAPVLLAGSLAVALSACGTEHDVLSSPSTKSFTVMLDWFPNADHAALYSAIANGNFRAVGLDVKPVVPAETAEPLKLLAAGKVDVAISYEPEVLLARDQGMKLVSIGALVQRPLTSIIALPKSHVSSVADLAGTTVGTAGIPYQADELHTATLGGYWNYEAIQLQLAHKHPTVIPVNQAGVPSYDELVLVVRESEARHDGVDLRAFLAALTQGEKEVRANPGAAAALLVKANPSLEAKLQLESIKQTLPAAQPGGNHPFGWQSESAWASFGNWMFSRGLLKNDPGSSGLPPFTNEFLPGEGI